MIRMKYPINNLHISKFSMIITYALACGLTFISCEMCSEVHDRSLPEFMGLKPETSYDKSTQYDYMCQELKPDAAHCTFFVTESTTSTVLSQSEGVQFGL